MEPTNQTKKPCRQNGIGKFGYQKNLAGKTDLTSLVFKKSCRQKGIGKLLCWQKKNLAVEKNALANLMRQEILSVKKMEEELWQV